jgi:transcriptional regulator with XRE-family HTH domain
MAGMKLGALDAFLLAEVRLCLAQLEGSQEELGARFGLTQKQMSRIRTGDWKNPPASVLDAIAKAAGASLIDLIAKFEGAGPPPVMSPSLAELVRLYRELRTREKRLALLEMARGFVGMQEAAGQTPSPRTPPGRPS